jgi:hypothetical protein
MANPTSSWENNNNLTGLNPYQAIEINSRNDAVYVLSTSTIEEWSFLDNIRKTKIRLDFICESKIDWNDREGLIALTSSGNVLDLGETSHLKVISRNGTTLHEFSPWGNLEPYPNSTIADIEWRPNSTHLAVLFHDGKLIIYNITSESVMRSWKFDGMGYQIRWSPSGDYLAVMTSYVNMEVDIDIISIAGDLTWQPVVKNTGIIEIGWFYNNSDLLVLTTSKIARYNLETGIFLNPFPYSADHFFPMSNDAIMVLVTDSRMSFLNYKTGEIESHDLRKSYSHRGGWTLDCSYFIIEEEATGILRTWGKKPLIQPPVVTIMQPLPDRVISGSITISGRVDSQSVHDGFVMLKIGFIDWQVANGYYDWHFFFDTKELPDGIVTIRAKAIDPSGISDINSIIVRIENHLNINEPPTIRITTPSDGDAFREIVRITGIATDDQSIRSIQIRKGILPWKNIYITNQGEEVSWSTTLAIVDEHGNLTIAVRAFDGTYFSKVDIVTIDVQPPRYNNMNVVIQYPSSGSEQVTPFTAFGIVGNGVPTSVYIEIDSGPLISAIGTTNWNGSIPIQSIGYHNMNVFAIDNNGITKRNSTTFLVVSTRKNTHPDIGFTNIKNASIIMNNTIIKGWSSDDVHVVKVFIRLNGGNWTEAIGTTNWTFELNSSELIEGFNTIEARAIDDELEFGISSVTVVYSTGDFGNGTNPTLPEREGYYLIIIACIIIIFIQSIIIYRKRENE